MVGIPYWAKVRGPLEGYVDEFRSELQRLGYTPLSAAAHVRLMAQLSRWLAREGLPVLAFTAPHQPAQANPNAAPAQTPTHQAATLAQPPTPAKPHPPQHRQPQPAPPQPPRPPATAPTQQSRPVPQTRTTETTPS